MMRTQTDARTIISIRRSVFIDSISHLYGNESGYNNNNYYYYWNSNYDYTLSQ